MKQPRISETAEHRAVADFLRWGLDGNAIGVHCRNEQPSAWQRITGARAGVLPGLCDFLVIYGGGTLGFELKPRGWRMKKLVLCTSKLTVHERRQLDVHRRLRRAGCPVEIVETLDETIAWLRGHGVPLRTQEPGVPPPPTEARSRGDRLIEGGR